MPGIRVSLQGPLAAKIWPVSRKWSGTYNCQDAVSKERGMLHSSSSLPLPSCWLDLDGLLGPWGALRHRGHTCGGMRQKASGPQPPPDPDSGAKALTTSLKPLMLWISPPTDQPNLNWLKCQLPKEIQKEIEKRNISTQETDLVKQKKD